MKQSTKVRFYSDEPIGMTEADEQAYDDAVDGSAALLAALRHAHPEMFGEARG